MTERGQCHVIGLASGAFIKKFIRTFLARQPLRLPARDVSAFNLSITLKLPETAA